MKDTYPGYFDSLKNSDYSYPNPAFGQIELDLKRTYSDVTDEKRVLDLINHLRNVLYCFVLRNPTVGYCQGMNFIAGRLLQCFDEDEENAFWAMC